MQLVATFFTLLTFAILLHGQHQQPLHTPSNNALPTTTDPSYLPSLLSFHKNLVNIPSVTGNESAIAAYLTHHLHSLNFTTELQPVGPQSDNRNNIYAYPAGCDRRTPVLLSSHIDTVPPFYPYRRTAGLFDEDPVPDALLSELDTALASPITLHGRGSVDDLASLVTQITALTNLLSSHSIPPCSTGLLFVVGEETDGAGMRTANDINPGWRAVIFGEPTENRLAAGHKGITMFTLRTEGQAGHSGYPWLAVSANELLVRALGGLQGLVDGGGLPSSKKFGNTTVNVGKIDGGVAGNVIPEKAEAVVTVRIAGGGLKEVQGVIEGAVGDATRGVVEEAEREGKHAKVAVEWSRNGYPPVNLDADVEVWDEEEVEEKRLSKGPITVNYGTDVPNLQGNHKRYLYGPGTILVAHSDHEALTVGELVKGVEGYERLLKGVVKNLDL